MNKKILGIFILLALGTPASADHLWTKTIMGGDVWIKYDQGAQISDLGALIKNGHFDNGDALPMYAQSNSPFISDNAILSASNSSAYNGTDGLLVFNDYDYGTFWGIYIPGGGGYATWQDQIFDAWAEDGWRVRMHTAYTVGEVGTDVQMTAILPSASGIGSAWYWLGGNPGTGEYRGKSEGDQWSVPEPTTLTFLACGALLACSRRRRCRENWSTMPGLPNLEFLLSQ